MLGETAHPFRPDALGWWQCEIIRIVHLEKAKPASIAEMDHLARAFGKVRSGSSCPVEHVPALVCGAERVTVSLRPFAYWKMLEFAHGFDPRLCLVGRANL